MRKVLLVVLVLLVAGVVYLNYFPFGARADRSFDVSVADPAFTTQHPILLFDEGHDNAHTIGGRYAPFATLMRNDGYAVKKHVGAFTREALQGANVLVIVNAAGGSNPKLFGINLPFLRKGERDAPAFTEEEIATVAAWVRGGGSLLLVADHYPFGESARSLAAAFGVTMRGGFVEVPDPRLQSNPSTVEFYRANGLLMHHPITNGRFLAERVDVVMAFTGQSLDADSAEVFLKLPASAKEFVPPPPNFTEQAAGDGMGFALEFGRGRVVVLGEAAMVTAQIEGKERFGMNAQGVDNKQLALNVVHWLSRLL
jgi:hypothetical protein